LNNSLAIVKQLFKCHPETDSMGLIHEGSK